jgi:isopropylmalate/homocitrate/citramalate synthase
MPKTDPHLLMQRIDASVRWLRTRIPGRIMMNVVDLMDAFYADRDYAAAVLALLAELPVDGLSFEDARGTYFPFQVGAMVSAAKAMLEPAQKVVFHCHAGNGMENASAIEALLNGADGYWGGMEKESSTIGHASLGELIANLARAGNANMAQRFQLDQLLPTCRALHQLDLKEATPEGWPITGANAYRQMLSGFDQVPGRLMDLPPDVIGEQYTFRISPDGSDIPVIQGRVLEALEEEIDSETADRMILLMRQDLMNGIRIRYDDPVPMRELLERARHALGQDPAPRWQTRSEGS